MLYNTTTNKLTSKGEVIFNTIWNNPSLKENLFGDDENIKDKARPVFINIISKTPIISNSFYNFIKVK